MLDSSCKTISSSFSEKSMFKNLKISFDKKSITKLYDDYLKD